MTAERPIDVIQWIRERLDFDPCHECDNATIAHDRLDEAEREFALIESEAAQAQGAAPRTEDLNAANEWEAGYQACYERMQDEGRLLPAAGRAAPSAPQALDVDEYFRSRLKTMASFGYQTMYNERPSCPFCAHFVDDEDTHADSCDLMAFLTRLAPSEPTETER